MKKYPYMLIMIIFIYTASASIVINEVLYDPSGTESGGEAVELYNDGNEAVNIGDFIIKTESSATDATIPSSTPLQPGGFYLIADVGWSTNKDDANWPDADHEESISLTNSNAGVALVDDSGNTIDAVGWGGTHLK